MRYEPVNAAHVQALHALLVDPHVRRYLLDGAEVDEDFAAEVIRDSEALFESRGVGLWLLSDGGAPFGFVGFRVFEDLSPEPQLLYGLVEAETGKGRASEAAAWAIERALEAGFEAIEAAVDSPNLASVRVLDKLGFALTRRQPGPFGETLFFERR